MKTQEEKMTSLHVPPEAAKWIISLQKFRTHYSRDADKDILVQTLSTPFQGLGHFKGKTRCAVLCSLFCMLVIHILIKKIF